MQYYALHDALLAIISLTNKNMKRVNQRGTTVFHPETFDAKKKEVKCLDFSVNLQYALYTLPNM